MIDTLTISKKLEKSGLSTKQSEAITLAIAEKQNELATKEDFNHLKGLINRNFLGIAIGLPIGLPIIIAIVFKYLFKIL